MTNTAEQLEIEEVPSGGIGDFVMSDQAFRVLERQNAEEEYGNEGIARFEDTAGRIAAYGRFGDDQVAHVETGELIVPRRLIDQSPELKESIFQHLRAAGIEDPERYVVGDAENSINPETGLMEFGFFSKIFKGIKKVFKKIGKVLKKAAPIILSIGLSMTGLGAIYGAALGSGIGTLIQGGSIKDALKSGLIAGVTGGIFKGISNVAQGGTFTGGIGEALANPGARFAQTGGSFADAFRGIGQEGGEGFFKTAFSKFDPTQAASEGAKISPIFEEQASLRAAKDALKAGTAGAETAADAAAETAADAAAETMSTTEQLTGSTPEELQRLKLEKAAAAEAGTKTAAQDALKTATRGDATGFFGNLGEAGGDILSGEFRGSLTNLKEAFLPKLTAKTANQLAIEAGFKDGITDAALSDAMKTSLLERAGKVTLGQRALAYAPLAGVGTLAAAGGGFFEVPDQEEAGLLDRDEDGKLRTGSDYVDEDPYKYRVYPTGFQPTYRPPPSVLVPYPMQQVAQGGEIFPRRTGGIMPNEGVPNEDSVKAMLMPGEFVMTTTAVRGAGDGDLKKGINNMYSVMRNLESRGRAVS
jgi:hypothetical protein